jgi:UrcA family protein
MLNSSLRTALPLSLALLLVGTMSACASPAFPEEVATRKVFFGDLNLQRTEGVVALYSRITRAAREVCGEMPGSTPFAVVAESRCMSASVTRAVRDVGTPALAEFHAAKTGLAVKLAQRP